jgi:hypothetical protein
MTTISKKHLLGFSKGEDEEDDEEDSDFGC